MQQRSHEEKRAHQIKGHLKNPTGKKSGFIQATFYEDPARERADIPPGGARSWYLPETGRRRRIEQWQQLNPPFSFLWFEDERQGQ